MGDGIGGDADFEYVDREFRVAHAVPGHVHRNHAVPDRLIPPAGAEAAVAADHGEPAAALADQLGRPLELLGGERPSRDITTDDHVVIQQLFAARRISAPAFGEAMQPGMRGVHVVHAHRDACDVGVLFQGVMKEAVLGVPAPLHVDDAELRLANHDLERDDIVRGDGLVRDGLHVHLERTPGSIRVDDQLVRLLAAGKGDGGNGQHVASRPVALPDAKLGALTVVTAAAQRHPDRDPRPRPCLPGRVDSLHGDIARDPLVAEGDDVNRHAQLAIGAGRRVERLRLG